MRFNRECDWDGDEKSAAMVYLSRKVRIRLTDLDRNPVPHARCRTKDDPDTIYEGDDDGVVEISLRDSGQTSVDLEWELPESEGEDERFYWSATFRLDIESKDDPICQARLENLGFPGDTLEDQVAAYQAYFDREPGGELADVRDELVDWHDGGECPDGAPYAELNGPAPSDSEEDTAQEDVSICLLDFDKQPMPGARCRTVDDCETLYTADENGIVTIPVSVGAEAVDLEWGPPMTFEGRDGTYFYLRQKITLAR
jgi:hypothetical protein